MFLPQQRTKRVPFGNSGVCRVGYGSYRGGGDGDPIFESMAFMEDAVDGKWSGKNAGNVPGGYGVG